MSIHKPIHLRRVAITGLGAITPLGSTLSQSWNKLMQNAPTFGESDDGIQCGIITFEQSLLLQDLNDEGFNREWNLAKTLPSQVAAPVHGIKADPRTGRFVQLALEAGEEAIRQAKLESWLDSSPSERQTTLDNALEEEEDYFNDEVIQRRRERTGTIIGSGMSSVRETINASHVMSDKRGLRRLSPHFVPKVLGNSAAGRLSLRYKMKGPNHAPTTACAAGAHAIGDAMRCIQLGDADIMVAGGAEACIDPWSMAGFCRLKALSTQFNAEPTLSSRPFDRHRDGFVMGEGAGVLVLEEWEHARRRGVPILAELCGYGLTGDGHHVTAPDPEGGGAIRAMQMAMDRAGEGIGPERVDYVNAHATSTPMGDDIEARAIDRTLLRPPPLVGGDGRIRTEDLVVSSTKGATGHLLGAAGAVEAAFTVMSIVEGKIPPTRNLSLDDDGGGLEESKTNNVGFRHVTDTFLEKDVRVAISNSFGFGGTNASLLFTSPNNVSR